MEGFMKKAIEVAIDKGSADTAVDHLSKLVDVR